AGTFAGSYMRLTWVMDHIVYLPLIGLVGLAAGGIELVHRRVTDIVRPLVTATAAALLVLLGLDALSYAKIYVSPELYWDYAIAKNPNTWIGYNNRGLAFLNQHDYPRARTELEHALQLQPDYPDAHTNLGQLEFITGDYPGAANDLDQAIRFEPTHS